MMLLTVVVPSYNAEDYLETCLDSMRDARFAGRLEVVVVDDGSTDATGSIAARYAARMPDRFRVISQRNGGHGAAVNAGLCAARGKYLRIVDADDWVDAGGLCALLDAMEAHDPDVFVDEHVERFRENEKRIALPAAAPTGEVVDFQALFEPRYDRNIKMHTLTARTSLLRQGGIELLPHTYYVDMQYVIGVISFARTAFLLRRAVYQYRLGELGQSVSPANLTKNYEQHNQVLLACVAFFKRNEPRMPAGRSGYVRRQLALLANTQYNIAYIYNPNRREGFRQAQMLSRHLGTEIPWLFRATQRRRMTAHMLHALGVNYDQLQRLKTAAGRK